MKIYLLKQFLVDTAISIVLLASSACVSNMGGKIIIEEEKFEPTTPLKDSKSQMEQETLGEKTAQKQAEILTKDHFQKVLGEAVVNKMAVDWSVLSNQEKSFDDPSKRQEFKKLKRLVSDIYKSKEGTNSADNLYVKILKLEAACTLAHEERLEKNAATYFESKFPGATIEFSPKFEGAQLGTIATITSKEKKTITYYIKTHSSGLKSEDIYEFNILDPKELMVYKILEKLNIGCEAHFFGRDLSNFYIATKDANSEGPFITYGDLQVKEGILKQIWDQLLNKKFPSDSNLKDATNHFMKGIISLDLVARMLRLTDLNRGNFGFVEEKPSFYQVKAIDFRIQPGTTLEVTGAHFNGLLEGNGPFTYQNTAMLFLFTESSNEDRMEMTSSIFNKEFLDFEKIVQDAGEEVITAIKLIPQEKQGDLSHQMEMLEAQVGEYSKAIINNFKLFKEKLAKLK